MDTNRIHALTHPARRFLDAVELSSPGGDAFARLESAAQNAATSAYSRNPPTLAQREASDYMMGHAVLHGIPVRIENPRNTWREGVSPDGKPWRTRLAAHYGDFPDSRGNDGDPVDVFIGPFPESTALWVINQRHIGTDKLDEHKVMAGFLTEQQARDAYADSFDRGWTGLMSIVRATVPQFKWWLKSGDKSRPFSVDQLPLEGNRIMDKVLWNNAAEPVTTTLHRLMYDLRVHDGKAGLLLDSATMADLMGDPDIESVQTYDALVVEVNRMSVKMDMLKSVMAATSGTVKPTAVTISDPVKARSVLQVMVLFEMSDGQTIAIWFHNPDTTPAKLMPLDELISWKWMLNKRDITITVAPERGKELNVREVARRVMRLVERNSEAYQKANAKAGERAAESAALDTEITDLEAELTDLNRQIEVARVKKEDAAAAITRKISALQGEQSRVFDLFEKEKSFGAAADKVKIESLLNRNDDLADEIRVLHGEAVAGRSSWAQWQALREAEAARNAPDPAPVDAILHSFPGEDNMQAEVRSRPDGKFSAILRDLDSGNSAGIFIVDTEEGAIAKAKELVGSRSGAKYAVGDQVRLTGGYSYGNAITKESYYYVGNITAVKEAFDGFEYSVIADNGKTFEEVSEASIEPVQAGFTPDGRESKVKTAKGTEVVTGFAVVEASRLITSHDPASGDVNPEFPQELQPRDRGRETSRAWVLKTAASLDPEQLGKTRRADTGAPIVGPDRVVESGNGRTMAIVEAYRIGKADEYRAWLESEADYFGLSAEKIKTMKRPVLVRIRTSNVNRAEFAVEANQDDKLAMTATEKARADANRLTDDMIALMTDNGDLNAAANTRFLSAFLASLGDAEAAQYSTSEGKPTSSLIARVQAAIFAKAYNDDRLLELTADSAKPEIANIIRALNFAAPEFIQSAALDPLIASHATKKLTDSIEASLNEQAVAAIIGATNVIKQAKESGMQVDEFIKQQGLFGDLDPSVAAMAVFISKNNRSAKRMGAAFKAMATFVKGEIERRQTSDMFGEPVPIGFPEIIAAANRELDRAFGEGAFAIETVDLFARPVEPAMTVPAAIPLSKPAHEVTLAEFIKAATVAKLENHGRKWEVTYVVSGQEMHGFSDADTSEGAIRDQHEAMVSNAIYANSPDATDSMKGTSMPPAEVLAEYPALAKWAAKISAAPPTTKNIPATVRRQVGNALTSMRTVHAAVTDAKTLDVKFGAQGRYESEALENNKFAIDAARKTLATFRQRAPGNGIDAEAVIASMGGEPDLTPSAEAQTWSQGSTEPAPTQAKDPQMTVDTAYLFADASNAFKRNVAGSVEETDYSTFATAKAMDMRAKELALNISWDVSAVVMDSAIDSIVLDNINAGDLGPVFTEYKNDPEGAIKRLMHENSGDARAVWTREGIGEIDLIWGGDRFGLSKIVRKHPEAISKLPGILKSGKIVRTEGSNKVFLIDEGNPMHVTVIGLDYLGEAKAWVVTSYDDVKGRFTGRLTSVDTKALDSAGMGCRPEDLQTEVIIDDAGDFVNTAEMAIGKIKQGAKIIGRAYIGGDGKAMVYLGKVGTERVRSSSGKPAVWSDDDAADLVGYLVANQYDPDVVTVYVGKTGKEAMIISKSVTNSGREIYFSSGEYASAGNYDHAAMLALVAENKQRHPEMKLVHGVEFSELAPEKTEVVPDPEEAKSAGKAAFLAGEQRMAPTELPTVLKKVWFAAWDRANLEAPLPEEKPQGTGMKPLPVPASNPAKEADAAYLQSLINGTTDMFAADVFDRLEPMFAAYKADAAMMALLERAAKAYGDAAVKAAQAALATA